MTAWLEIKNLVNKYKNLTAVGDVSFAIQQGICFGLLGPNGAGKTTLVLGASMFSWNK
jgi:ABC-2 type transport system ATP-binding protein